MTILGYLDPGTGTLIMQAVIGGVAGVAVLVKTKGRRLFKKGRSDEPTGDADDDATVDANTEEPAAPDPSD